MAEKIIAKKLNKTDFIELLTRKKSFILNDLFKIMPIIKFHNIGLKDYKEVWDFQEELFSQVSEQKNHKQQESFNHLIFCQHPHVYTLGRNGSENNLLINHIQLQAKNATFYKINRGGDITYHGPGQLVGYPIFNLAQFNIGLKDYIYSLEEAIILSLSEYGLKGERMKGATGVWIDTAIPAKARKICAIGVRSSHWVTMHGFALNVNTDLTYFLHINPCGFTNRAVTSLDKELGGKQDFNTVSKNVLEKLKQVFNFEIIPA
jgi:lipoyl(octanoyl) transferase